MRNGNSEDILQSPEQGKPTSSRGKTSIIRRRLTLTIEMEVSNRNEDTAIIMLGKEEIATLG